MAFSHGLRWCVLWIILVSAINVHRTTVLARKIAHKVELCPKNTKEWQIASRRLNCTNDISNTKNRYHCLPANDLSTLVEFCYDETRLGVVKGSCMLYVQRINYLDDYNCSGFRYGCPDKMYFSDESYLFPRCSEIIPERLCFVAESSCKGNASGNLQTSHPASTEPSKRKDNALAWSISLAIALLLVVIVIVIICNWKKGACQNRLETFCANSSESPTTARSQSSGVANEEIPFLAIASGSVTASNESKREDMHSISDQTMSDWCLLDLIKEWPEILISNVGKEEPVDEVAHISRVTSNFICLDNKQWVVKIDHKGNILGKHELGDFWGSASSTVDENGDLLIIRQNNKVVKVKANKEEPIEVLSVDRRWSILSVHFSRFSGEILLRIYLQKWNKYSTHIVRYNKDREKSLEFEYHKHDKLIVYPLFLSENVNHDICIADNYDCRVIAFDKKGIEKYIYKGPLPDYNFSPTGLCNDKRGHVLVCNCHESNPSVHLLNIKGMLLSIIIGGRPDVKEPWGLCVDDNGKFYLGQKKCDVIKVFQYLKKS